MLLSPAGLRRIPISALLTVLLTRLALLRTSRRRPAGGMPAGRRTVVRLRRTRLRLLAGVRAVAVPATGLLGLRRRGRLGDRFLEGRFRHRLGPRLAAFDRQLTRSLDWRLVGRDTTTEVVEHRQTRPLLHLTEDGFQLLAVQRLLLQEFTGQDVEDIAVLGEDRPRLGVGGLNQLADLVVDVAGDLVAVVRLGAHRAAQEGSPCSVPYLTAPSLELMPYSVTIALAILVA